VLCTCSSIICMISRYSVFTESSPITSFSLSCDGRWALVNVSRPAVIICDDTLMLLCDEHVLFIGMMMTDDRRFIYGIYLSVIVIVHYFIHIQVHNNIVILYDHALVKVHHLIIQYHQPALTMITLTLIVWLFCRHRFTSICMASSNH
jgi:hypothetical protein